MQASPALPPDFAALDANLVESLREAVRWQRGASLYEGDGLLIAHGCTNFPVGLSNAAARLDPAVPAAEVIARARAHFAGEARTFTLWVRGAPDADLEAAAESAKLLPVSPVPSPWMVLRKRLPDPAPPRDVRVELVRDESRIRDVVAVSQAAWAPAGLPPAETASLLGRADRMLAPHLVWSLAWRDDRPVACAMALCSHGVAGIYWVGTVPDARRRGLAEIVTRAAGNAGFDRGMRVAALQASAMGYPVYQRMGYETVSHTRWYLARPTRR
ncbi:MAG TPA: GNAT family N-acetyltransferase [Myxococcota bacterium]|nr:GNAT family N-acetyltransferase [Myxococcota bacterium]